MVDMTWFDWAALLAGATCLEWLLLSVMGDRRG